MDYATLPTPPTCVADFCLNPIGTPTASIANEVAAVQRLMKASGLSYRMHSAGTTVEGPWESVTRLIGQAHTLVHRNGVVRIQTDVRIGTRTDKEEHFAEKVSKVESILTEQVHDAGGGDEAEEDTVKLQRPV
ncbi:YkoF-like protein [Hyaloscypha sp. PMI_1271]|nr:YkoF-like protein [Hyaloscypha sp. PMI_1271]